MIKHNILKKDQITPIYNRQQSDNNIELKCMRMLSPFHPENIIKFIDVISFDDSMFILMEYCSGGDLHEYINQSQFGCWV